MQKKIYPDSMPPTEGFLLNMQILADSFEDRYDMLEFSPAGNRPTLKSVRHYRNGTTPTIGHVYILWAFQINERFSTLQDVSLIIIGDPDLSKLSDSTSYIVLSENADISDVFDYTTDIFLRYSAWDLALQKALNSDNPLNDMLQASLGIFRNPMFIHDTDFYILACPNVVEGMTVWTRDSRNGRDMVPLEVINDLKIDHEYVHTLQTQKADMFSANQRGYRILYNNLWNGNRYEGRVLVNELQSIIKPGDYLALEYLSSIVLACISKRNIFWTSLGRNAEEICKQILSQSVTDEREISRLLRFLGWGYHDKYVIIKLGTEHANTDYRFTTSTFGYIESQVAASHAFFYDQSIVVIVNQTVGKSTTPQIVSNMAWLLREGLFKMGVSNDIYDFSQIHQGYRQASIALHYGSAGNSMIWCYDFKDYVLEYMFDKICSEIPFEYLCAHPIQQLAHYDEKHNTKLNETLETYLRLERNVVQTAKTLYIHRSTLFYRLDRIQQLTNLDLDDPRVRLYLEISYQMNK